MSARITARKPLIIGAVALLAILALVSGSIIVLRGGVPLSIRSADLSFVQNVSAQSVLRLEFSEEVDQASVEANLSTDGISGTTAWDKNTLLFTPTQPLKKKSRISLKVGDKALLKSGRMLGKSLIFHFDVTGEPFAAARMPAPNSIDVTPATNITIVFDRPLVPLGKISDQTKFPSSWQTTLTPAVEGEWHWLSTHAVEFQPKTTLDPATVYSVSLPAGLQFVDGSKTTKDFSWQFQTARLLVASTEPSEGSSDASSTSTLTLRFNQEPNIESVTKHLTLASVITNSGSQKQTPLAIKSVKTGTKTVASKTVPDPLSVQIVPATALQMNSSYQLVLSAGTLGAKGNLGSASGYTLNFNTAAPLSVVTGEFQYGGIHLAFNNAIAEKTLAKAITITPTPKDWKELDLTLNQWGDNRDLTIYPALKPSTKYTVQVSPELRDVYGQRLTTPYSFSFTTKALSPEVTLHSRGTFGVWEKGKEPVMYINSLNAERVTITAAKLSWSQLLQNWQAHRQSNDSVPDFSQALKHADMTYVPKLGKNLWDVKSVDIGSVLGEKITSGIYGVRINQTPRKDLEDYDHSDSQLRDAYYFSYTNLAVTLKFSGNRALVWVTDMQSGNPVPNATVKFYSLSGNAVLTKATDSEGFVDTPIRLADFVTPQNNSQPEFFVTAEKDGDFAFVSSDWNNGLNPGDFSAWSDFQYVDSPALRPQTYVYTDRGLYKAGDTVEFKGIVRFKDWNGAIKLPESKRQAMVTIQSPSGTTVYTETLPISDFGSFTGTFRSIPTAELGEYSIQLNLVPGDDVVGNPLYWVGSFRLAAYRKPEFKLDLTTTSPEYTDRQTLGVNIAGAYYFGAPLRGGKYTWTAEFTDYYFNKYTMDDGWYSFALEDNWCYWNCERRTTALGSGEGTLDSNGQAKVTMPLSLSDKAISQIATVNVEVTDQNNQGVSNSVAVPVHKSQVYIGIRTDESVFTPGSSSKARLITLKPDGTPAPNQNVQLQLFSRTWTSIRKKGVDGEFYYENEPKDTLVNTDSGTTDADGKLVLNFTVPSGGEYRLIASGKDSSGNSAKAGTSLYAWSDTYINWPRSNNDRMDIVTDKPSYKVGETAKLLVKSPYQGKGVKALVTVERDNLITKSVIDIKSTAQTISVPIEDALVPNAYVSVIILKPRQGETFDKEDRDTGAPAFKIGYAQLHIETETKVLNVEVKTEKKQYQPGDKVNVTITTRDYQNKPVAAEVSLATVDLSLLALTGNPLPNLVEQFYSQHGLGVMTAESLNMLLERFKPGSKGGGGGEDGDSSVRGNFKDTAFWQANVVTNADGTATLSFTLPDNLTTWQLLAIAHTKNHLFGTAKTEIVETKDILVRLVRPRFALVDDAFNLGAIIHNEKDTDTELTVTLSGSGFTAKNTTQKIRVKAHEQQKLEFPLTITTAKRATFRVSAKSNLGNDTVEESIPVDRALVPQTTATAGNTMTHVTEKITVPTAEVAPRGQVELRMSPSLLSYLPGGLEYVTTYPYGCAEQTTSAFLPSLILSRLQGYESMKLVDQATLKTRVETGIHTLYAFQNSDGGFKYFEESLHSNPYLTAYVLFALEQAAKANYTVDRAVISRATDYLNQYLRNQNMSSAPDLAIRTYILFVLSENATVDQNLVVAMVPLSKDLPAYSRAELAMALKNIGQNGQASKLLTTLVNEAKVDPRGTHFEEADTGRYWYAMQSASRTTATVLRAIIRIEPSHPLAPDMIKWLLNARINQHWDSTQSTSTVLLTLLEYVQASGELDSPEKGKIAVNGKTVLEKSFATSELRTALFESLSLDTLGRGTTATVDIDAEGKGRLYYDIVLQYDTVETDPVENGLSITRKITELNDTDPRRLPEISTAKLGENYRVTLTITVPEEGHQVAVESMLPAGFEAIDFSFATAPGGRVREAFEAQEQWNPWYQSSEENALWYFSHREFRDDRVFLFADWLPAGVYKYTYLVRATQPGNFSLRPSRVWQMYFPEVLGQTEGKRFVVQP